MRLDKVHIKNFRCFEDYQVTLGKETTILIGKNGSGKTNLIAAIKNGLSFIFSKSKRFEKSLSDINGCKIRQFELWDTRFDALEKGFSFPTEITYSGEFNEAYIEWIFFKKQNPGRLFPTAYDDALNSILDYYNNAENSILPLISFFSDAYPHIRNVNERAMDIIKRDIIPREFGYYSWDEETNCAELWQARYVKIYNAIQDVQNEVEYIKKELAILGNDDEGNGTAKGMALHGKLNRLIQKKEADGFLKQIEFINNKILTFTASGEERYSFINEDFAISSILVNRPDRRNAHINFLFNNGQTMFFDILPQGYKRLLSIVLDIAFRSLILNGTKEPKGIVFIDEVELHLHPTLQQEVVNRFKRTFPAIQFIFSTHSPLVISNLKADGERNKIIKLEHRGTEFTHSTVENIYGVSYTTTLTEIMESGYRTSTIDKLIHAYLVMKGKGREDTAETYYNELKRYLDGNIPRQLEDEIEEQLKAYQ